MNKKILKVLRVFLFCLFSFVSISMISVIIYNTGRIDTNLDNIRNLKHQIKNQNTEIQSLKDRVDKLESQR